MVIVLVEGAPAAATTSGRPGRFPVPVGDVPGVRPAIPASARIGLGSKPGVVVAEALLRPTVRAIKAVFRGFRSTAVLAIVPGLAV